MANIQKIISVIPTKFYLVLPIVWMILIFTLSNRQSIAVSQYLLPNFVFFKSLHIIEYAILTFLNIMAITVNFRRPTFRYILLISALLALLFAISDEIHQLYVPTREGRFRDVLIDSIGIFSVYCLAIRYEKRISKVVASTFYPKSSQ